MIDFCSRLIASVAKIDCKTAGLICSKILEILIFFFVIIIMLIFYNFCVIIYEDLQKCLERQFLTGCIVGFNHYMKKEKGSILVFYYELFALLI